MSNLRNSVRLVGILGNEPVLKTVGNKQKLVKLFMATRESWLNEDGQKVEETQWHHLVLWNNKAKIAEKYLKKGSEITIEGKLAYWSFTDKEGVKRYYTQIIVNDILMMRGVRN